MITAGLDALPEIGSSPYDAGVIREDLEIVAVVLLEEVDHQIADGVVAQVGTDIADAQAAAGFDRRRAAVEARGAVFDRRHGADVLVAGGELEQRIVGVGADRQRMQPADQRAARDFRTFRRHRPFALGQARCDVLFGDIAGIRRKIEALRQRGFGGGERVIVRQDAADLFQSVVL
jgi:hypothetical protein